MEWIAVAERLPALAHEQWSGMVSDPVIAWDSEHEDWYPAIYGAIDRDMLGWESDGRGSEGYECERIRLHHVTHWQEAPHPPVIPT